MRTVTLVKDSEVYSYTYKSLPDHEAAARARKALARDRPGEDPADWQLQMPVESPAVAG